MSGILPPAQLGRSSLFALAVSTSIFCAASVKPAIAALPFAPAIGSGSVSLLGNNTFETRYPIPRRDRFNLLDQYNSLSTPARSIIGLAGLGSFGLLASFRPLDTKQKRG